MFFLAIYHDNINIKQNYTWNKLMTQVKGDAKTDSKYFNET